MSRIAPVVSGLVLAASVLGSVPAVAQGYYHRYPAYVGGYGSSCGPWGGPRRPGCDEYGRRYRYGYGGPGNGPSCGPWGGRRRPGCDEYGRRYAHPQGHRYYRYRYSYDD